MENLSKENFWNEMTSKYPKAMKQFDGWLKEYKVKNDWEGLFTTSHVIYDWNDEITIIDFNDLPLAMQLGIWDEYLCGGYHESLIYYAKKDIDYELGLKETELNKQ